MKVVSTAGAFKVERRRTIGKNSLQQILNRSYNLRTGEDFQNVFLHPTLDRESTAAWPGVQQEHFNG